MIAVQLFKKTHWQKRVKEYGGEVRAGCDMMPQATVAGYGARTWTRDALSRANESAESICWEHSKKHLLGSFVGASGGLQIHLCSDKQSAQISTGKGSKRKQYGWRLDRNYVFCLWRISLMQIDLCHAQDPFKLITRINGANSTN
jgi:hypothetical protein